MPPPLPPKRKHLLPAVLCTPRVVSRPLHTLPCVGLCRTLSLPVRTFARQEDNAARWLLATVVALTLLNSGVSVAFSYIGRDFWTALSNKDPAQFNVMLQRYVPVPTWARFGVDAAATCIFPLDFLVTCVVSRRGNRSKQPSRTKTMLSERAPAKKCCCNADATLHVPSAACGASVLCSG